MFSQPMQRQPLIQNLVELEREVAHNGVAKALTIANQHKGQQTAEKEKDETILGQVMVRHATPSLAV